MDRVLMLPGDGYGPSIIDAAERAVSMAADGVEVVRGDIGFAAYERTGEYLPRETLDLVRECGTTVCGPVRDHRDDAGRTVNPLDTLRFGTDLYAITRSFRSLADDMGRPGIDVTLWASNTVLGSDIVETRDIDGITISKYIRSSSYSRMIARALDDMELSGGRSAVCVAQDSIFPDSSALFRESFDSLFDPGSFRTEHRDAQYWASKFVRDPCEFDYVVCADLYSSVAGGIMAGMTGGNRLTPIAYVGDGCSLIVPGLYRTFEEVPKGYANPTSAMRGAAMALRSIGRREEAESILKALGETYRAGERTPDAGGSLTTAEFTDRVLSRI